MTHTPGARRATTLSLLLAVLAAVAVLVGLAAGGGSAGAADGTAPSDDRPAGAAPAPARAAAQAPRPARAAPAAPAEAVSPQMQLGETDAVRESRIGAWQQCLVDHGATWAKDVRGPARTGVGPTPVADPVPAAAKAACEDVLPRLPVETDPRHNPDYVADSEANVACLRAHGIAVHLYHDTSVYPDGLGWTYDATDTPVPDDSASIERSCEVEAFSD
ncbi:hypothetical protein [Nocardioides sp. 503]|uniref:hypothetical protein n=1 Tax=Nocardioides sp. 503 TaxID=2508326 RepID=UPI00106FDAF1|nr:hypothetical protein [Nocardioides sp. 503]